LNTLKMLEPISTRSVVDTVIDRITNAILFKEFRPGEKIPTEDQLSSAFGVSRNSVREAVKVLVSLGVLEIRRAEGTFVARKFSERMFNPVLYGMIVEDSTLTDLVEVRWVFDSGILRGAIEKGTEEDMARIKHQCDLFMDALINNADDYEALMQCDLAFHQAIEQAAHNALLTNLNRIITQMTLPSRAETLRQNMQAEGADFFIRSHKLLTEIVIERQADRIAEGLDFHYDKWREIG
jgi:GntR family transcriptional repressor for pyruvate dehydrogenase complex